MAKVHDGPGLTAPSDGYGVRRAADPDFPGSACV